MNSFLQFMIRRGWIFPLSVCLWFVGVFSDNAVARPRRAKEDMEKMGTYIFYTESIEPRGSLEATIQDRVGEVRLDTSIAPSPQIGLFKTELRSDVVEGLHAELKRLGLGKTGPLQSLLPGTSKAEIGIVKDGVVTAVHSFIPGQPPKNLANLLELFRPILAELLRHPYRALSAHVSWDHSEIAAGSSLAITLRLRNSGVTSLEVFSPAAGQTAEEIGLNVVLIKNKSFFRKERLIDIVIEPDDVQEAEGHRAESQRNARLEPGKELVLRLKKPLKIAPGHYRGIVWVTIRAAGLDKSLGAFGKIEAALPSVQIR
jgi:hypothetical protein